MELSGLRNDDNNDLYSFPISNINKHAHKGMSYFFLNTRENNILYFSALSQRPLHKHNGAEQHRRCISEVLKTSVRILAIRLLPPFKISLGIKYYGIQLLKFE